jgi:fidgetin-like protein 1
MVFNRAVPGQSLPEELSRLDPALIEQVCNEVIDNGGQVTWEDIAGQLPAKKLIQEVVVWPMLNPHIFKGARAPPKGILLFGPPGTGKTLLGKAIASNIRASFFSISASSLTSKWIGEGEKMVRTLFAVAGWLAPAVIFIDEIDSLLSARKSEGEHEASRRLKTEMLVQMEGCDPASADRRVLLIGATNRPEELDEAARRRMPKQLYIPLPDAEARRQMILRQMGPGAKIAATLSDSDVDRVVTKTEGYSGSDLKNLIQEACQGPVRDAVRAAGAGVAGLQETDLRPVILRDFAMAAKAQRASVEPAEVRRYEIYNEKHGAKIVDNDGNGADAANVEADDDW